MTNSRRCLKASRAAVVVRAVDALSEMAIVQLVMVLVRRATVIAHRGMGILMVVGSGQNDRLPKSKLNN